MCSDLTSSTKSRSWYIFDRVFTIFHFTHRLRQFVRGEVQQCKFVRSIKILRIKSQINEIILKIGINKSKFLGLKLGIIALNTSIICCFVHKRHCHCQIVFWSNCKTLFESHCGLTPSHQSDAASRLLSCCFTNGTWMKLLFAHLIATIFRVGSKVMAPGFVNARRGLGSSPVERYG